MQKILIVDDVELNRDLMRHILKEQYEIYEAKSGVEAAETIQKMRHELNMILLDLRMPGYSGYKILQNLHEATEKYEIPILVISADEASESEHRCMESGACGYIRKPFSRSLLLHTVQEELALAEASR